MEAIILNEYGAADNLQLADLEKPQIKKDEVLVKVKAISINPVDVKSRAHDWILSWLFGEERPVILGWDISGVVVEKGTEVSDLVIGDEVFGMVNFFGKGNAYAEYVAVPANQLALKPTNVSHEEAAGATLAASTAYQALVNVAKIKRGDRVLIHAASGGVGHFAVQLARYFGAYVIGTSSAKNKEFLLSLGVDEHIDYTGEGIAAIGEKVDIVIDTIAGDTLYKSIEVVRNGGIIVTLVSHDIPPSILEKAKEHGVNVEFMMVASSGETMKEIASLLYKGVVKSSIHKVFPFREMSKAHAEVETNRVVGKVIVTL